MPTATLVSNGQPGPRTTASTRRCLSDGTLAGAVTCNGAGPGAKLEADTNFLNEDLASGAGLLALLDHCSTDFIVIADSRNLDFAPRALARMLDVAEQSGAGLVYSDYSESTPDGPALHPLIDYQIGSLRDDFDFGPMLILSRRCVEQARARFGDIDSALRWSALYDLRLKLSAESHVVRVPENLYTRHEGGEAPTQSQFDYLDARNRDYQAEMETVATRHLKRIGAYLAPDFTPLPQSNAIFPVRATIVIPVKNRARTIADAVWSALSQEASFSFNIVVVDNHSDDGTTETLRALASKHDNIVHLIPAEKGHGIGGCWNEALNSEACGEYAVQLDSDDIYTGKDTLARIVAEFGRGPFAMVIGSYRITDFKLNEIPPGLIDHREWTRENGRNNALRIGGLGAPRAFYTPIVRRFGFPDASYGEDYAVGLRISRDYEIGRIYDPLYCARRWEGNSDAKLDTATKNRYDAYKDRLRTIEILARQRRNSP